MSVPPNIVGLRTDLPPGIGNPQFARANYAASAFFEACRAGMDDDFLDLFFLRIGPFAQELVLWKQHQLSALRNGAPALYDPKERRISIKAVGFAVPGTKIVIGGKERTIVPTNESDDNLPF